MENINGNWDFLIYSCSFRQRKSQMAMQFGLFLAFVILILLFLKPASSASSAPSLYVAADKAEYPAACPEGMNVSNPPRANGTYKAQEIIIKNFKITESPEFMVGFGSINKSDSFYTASSQAPKEMPEVILKDADGKMHDIRAIIAPEGDGYRIAFQKSGMKKPGMYRLFVELEDREKEIWFTWGLVSANTKKSIYHPNETAEILIVVLD